jgi:two-component system sensor histidine kinase PilS (NtrC family)
MWLPVGRLVVCVFIIVYQIIAQGGTGRTTSARLVYVLAVAYLALDAVFLAVTRRAGGRSGFAKFQIALDILVEAVLVFLTGGATSATVILFGPSIVSASLLLSWRAAALFTAEAAAAHVLASAVARALPITPQAGALPVSVFASNLLLHLAGFCVVALLSGLLGHRLVLEKLRSHDLLEAIGQGLVIADPRGRILFANDQARGFLGRALSSGRPLVEALPPGVRQRAAMALEAGVADAFEAEVTLAEEPHVRGEARVRTEDRGVGTATARPSPVSDPPSPIPPGAPAETVPVAFEIKPMSADAGRRQGTLLVLTDRTLGRQLEEANARAQRSEAVRELATSIAHEIRNPLACMRASVQELDRRVARPGGHGSEETSRLFGIVLSESDRLDAIVADFLEFARTRPARKVQVNLPELLHEVAAVLGQMAGAGCADGGSSAVVVEVEGVPACRADREQLRQVIVNLGMNSLDAVHGRAQARIVLRARPCRLSEFRVARAPGAPSTQPQEQGVRIDVEDDGVGMSPEARRRAFDPFFTTKEKGTGMGLAIADRIVKAHRGHMAIESEESAGTTVSVWLPAGPPRPDSARIEIPRAGEAGGAAQ